MSAFQAIRAHRVFWAITGLSLVIGACNALGFWSVLMDDAWISLRYARNITLGLGPVYNPGERVEGFSNPLWTGLLALWLLVSSDGQLGMKVLGLVSHLAAVLGAALLALRLGRPSSREGEAAAGVAGLLVAVSLPLNYWATAGLETAQYIALLLGTLVALEHERDYKTRWPLSAALGALASISRPEAPLLVLPVVLGRGVHFWRDRDRAALARWLGVFAVPTVGYLLFRIAYYGLVLPNTAYVKGGQAAASELYAYLMPWLALEPLIALGGLLGLGLTLYARRVDGLPFVAMTVLGLLFVLRVGGDYTPNQRYLTPVVALLGVGLAVGAVALVERARARRAAALGVVCVLCFVQGQRSLGVGYAEMSPEGELTLAPRAAKDRIPASLDESVGSATLAIWLLERAPPQATVMVSTIGAVGYLADWKIIDLFGLVTMESTRLDIPDLMKWCHEQRPDWIVLRDLNIMRFRHLRREAWLRDDYEFVEGPSKVLWVGRRDDAPMATDDEVLANLTEAVARGPHNAPLHRTRLKWVFGVGDAADREAACRDAMASFPDEEGLRVRCEHMDREGRGRPEVPMVPVGPDRLQDTRGEDERPARLEDEDSADEQAREER